MASVHCAHCQSADTEPEADRVFCLGCGGWTDFHGNAIPRDPQFTRPSFQERREAGEVQ